MTPPKNSSMKTATTRENSQTKNSRAAALNAPVPFHLKTVSSRKRADTTQAAILRKKEGSNSRVTDIKDLPVLVRLA